MKIVSPQIKIQFLGAAGTVTGSKYLVQAHDKKILIDCGMFQGLKELRLLNWEKLPLDVSKIDLVLLTHGHLDHTGYLPRLVKDGYNGPIWGTAPTLEITKIILEDSAKIQEEDAERANTEKYSKHHPAVALYDLTDVEKTLPLLRSQEMDQWIKITDDIECRFQYNGHIIGATFIELKIASHIIVFSGDIGRKNDFLMFPPKMPHHADIIVIESTYGNRNHIENAMEDLAAIVNENISRNGTIVIPSFAVERTQVLMYMLWQLRIKNLIPPIPVYMDSPMGSNVLDVFLHNLSWHKLSAEDCAAMCEEIRLIESPDETKQIASSAGSKIIIAGSGMASGGRVLTYLARYLGDASATILLAGYQAEGTRGRALQEGASEIKLYGKYFTVRAKIHSLEGLSAHADQDELLDWLSNLESSPAEIFIVHGEPEASLELQKAIKKKYDWNAAIPRINQVSSFEEWNICT